MKKVSFIKGVLYTEDDITILPISEQNSSFTFEMGMEYVWRCTESFTAEIAVKIVPYE